MTKRITLTFNEDELERLAKLRDALNPDRPLATFAADCVVTHVEDELHDMKCRGQHLVQALYSWQPGGRPN